MNLQSIEPQSKNETADRDRPPITSDAAVTSALDRIGTTRATWSIVILVLLGVFFDVIEEGALGAAGPALMKAMSLSNLQFTALQTITIAAMIAGKFMTGVLGDRYGRKFTLSFNLAIYCVGALVCALAPNYYILALGRLIVGIGLGGEIPAAITLLSEVVATRNRGSFTAAVNIGGGGLGNPAAFALAALIFGPMVGVLGGPELAWRWLFGILAAPALLVLFYRRYLPESPRYLASKGRFDEANEVLSRIESGRLSGPLTFTNQYFPKEITRSENIQKPRISEVLRAPLLGRTAALSVASWMTFGAQISVLLLMPIILTGIGYDITDSLIFTMIMNFGSLCGAIIATYGAGKWPRKTTMIVAAVVGFIAALLFGLTADTTRELLIYGALFNCTLMVMNTTIFAWSPELFPTRVRAFGTAFIALQGNVGGAVFPLLSALILTNYGVSGMFIMISLIFIVMLIAVARAPETHGRTLEDISEGI